MGVRAAVVDSTWSGGETGNWSSAANWTPSAAYPQNATDTYRASLGNASVALGEDITIDALTIAAVDLNGAHALTVSGASGVLVDGLNSLSGGITLNVAAPFVFADNDAALTNHGTLVFKVSGAGNYTASSATLTNATDGTLKFNPSSGVAIGVEGSSPFKLINEGTVLANNGVGDYIHAKLTNLGLIHATGESTLTISGDSTLGGTLRADAGSIISFYSGLSTPALTFIETAITGAGLVSVSNSSLTGSLSSGSLLVAGGRFTGGFTINSAATLLWRGQNGFSGDSDSLTNHGTVDFGMGSWAIGSTAAIFVNTPTGMVTFSGGSAGAMGASSEASFVLINQGTVVANNGLVGNAVYVPVTNSGTMRATASSDLVLHAGSNLGGTLQADAGSTIGIYGTGGQTQTLTQTTITGSGVVSTASTKLTGSLKSGSLSSGTTTFTGTFTVETGGTLVWNSQNAFSANTDSLTNHGTVRFATVADNTYSTASSASFVNSAAGTISFVASGRMGDSDTVPFGLVNLGALLADTGTIHPIYVPVTNSGTLLATSSSTLNLNTASNLGGTLQADAGSTIGIYGPGGQTQTLTQAMIAGAGTVAAHSTKLTGSLKSGALSADNTTFTGTFTVEAGGTLVWDQQNAFSANSDTLTNHGTVRFATTADGTYSTASTATFVNASDGTVSFASSGRMGDSDTVPFNLINQGTLLADTPTSIEVFSPVTNSGTIRATSGSTLNLNTASNLSGTLQADTGSVIHIKGTGGQTQTLTQTTITGAGSVGAQSTKLTGSLKAGTLTADYTTFTGTFSLEIGGTLVWGDQNAFSANTDVLLNHGYVLFDTVSTDFSTASTATFTNAVDGVLTFSAGGQIGSATISPFSLNNFGTVVTGSSTTNQLRVPVTNFGSIQVSSGSTLGLDAFTQNSGEVFVNQGTLTTLGGQTLYFNGGTLRGAGTITAPLSLTSTGLEIGSGSTAGTLGITGATTFGSGSSFRVDLNGTTQGTGYDRLNVTGAVALGGDLMVRVGSSFLSSIQRTDSFTVLNATAGITGAFANVVSGQRAKLPSGLGSCLLTVTSATVTLSDFTSSTLNNFLATAGVPAASRAYDQDPDGDGITNLMEYALGLNPMSADVGGLPTMQASGGNLTLTYHKARNDVVYEAITTTTLSDPGSWTTTGVTQGTANGSGMVTASVPLTGGKAFLRLRVNYAP